MSLTMFVKLWPYASDLITAKNLESSGSLFLIDTIFSFKIFPSINSSDFIDVIHLKFRKNHH